MVVILTNLTATRPPSHPSLSETLTLSSHLSKLAWGLVHDTLAPKHELALLLCRLLSPGSPRCSSWGAWPPPSSEEEGSRYFPSISLSSHHPPITSSEGHAHPPLHQNAAHIHAWVRMQRTSMHGPCLLLMFLSGAAASSLPVDQIKSSEMHLYLQ